MRKKLNDAEAFKELKPNGCSKSLIESEYEGAASQLALPIF